MHSHKMADYRLGFRGMFVAAFAFAVATASPAPGQQVAGSGGWYPYYGCWQPVAAPSSASVAGEQGRSVCIVPVEGAAAIQLIAIRGDSVLERIRVNTSGVRTPAAREGCSGWESAQRGEAGRVYMRSEYVCEAGLQRVSSGIVAMLSHDEWLDVQTVTVGGQSSVLLQRYRELTPPAAVADEVSAAMRERGMAISSARVAATAPLSLDDIIEASANAMPSTVEAWLLEKRHGFVLQARHVAYLAESGVPENLIDVVVALSFPQEFGNELSRRRLALYPADATPVSTTRVASEDYVAPQTYNTGVDREYMDWRYYGGSVGGYCCRNRYYSPFGFNYYGSSWFDFPNFHNPRPVVIIIQDGGDNTGGGGGGGTGGGGGGGDPPPQPPPARLINGRGYTNGVQSTGATSQSAGVPPSSVDAGSGVGGASGSSTSATLPATNPAAGSGRVAVPRRVISNGGSSNGAASAPPKNVSSGAAAGGGRQTNPPGSAAPPRTAQTRSGGAVVRTPPPRTSASTRTSGSSSSSSTKASARTTGGSSSGGTSGGTAKTTSSSGGSGSSGKATARTAGGRGG